MEDVNNTTDSKPAFDACKTYWEKSIPCMDFTAHCRATVDPLEEVVDMCNSLSARLVRSKANQQSCKKRRTFYNAVQSRSAVLTTTPSLFG